MPTYYVELTKTVVVPIEAPSMAEAFEDAIFQSENDGFDNAWDCTQPEAKCVLVVEDGVPSSETNDKGEA